MRKGGLKSTYSLDFHSIDEVLGGLSAADVLEPGAPAEDADGRVCAMLATDARSHEDADDLPLTGNLPEAHGLRNDVLRLALAAKHCTEKGGNHVVRAAGRTLDQLVNGCRSLTGDVLGLTKTSVSDRLNGYRLSRAAYGCGASSPARANTPEAAALAPCRPGLPGTAATTADAPLRMANILRGSSALPLGSCRISWIVPMLSEFSTKPKIISVRRAAM